MQGHSWRSHWLRGCGPRGCCLWGYRRRRNGQGARLRRRPGRFHRPGRRDGPRGHDWPDRVNTHTWLCRVNTHTRLCRVNTHTRLCRVNTHTRLCRVNTHTRLCRVNTHTRLCRVNAHHRPGRLCARGGSSQLARSSRGGRGGWRCRPVLGRRTQAAQVFFGQAAGAPGRWGCRHLVKSPQFSQTRQRCPPGRRRLAITQRLIIDQRGRNRRQRLGRRPGLGRPRRGRPWRRGCIAGGRSAGRCRLRPGRRVARRRPTGKKRGFPFGGHVQQP